MPSYYEVVKLLESYADRNELDAPDASVAFYCKKSSKNKKQYNNTTSFNSKTVHQMAKLQVKNTSYVNLQ